jgi:hypothetical protein
MERSWGILALVAITFLAAFVNGALGRDLLASIHPDTAVAAA